MCKEQRQASRVVGLQPSTNIPVENIPKHLRISIRSHRPSSEPYIMEVAAQDPCPFLLRCILGRWWRYRSKSSTSQIASRNDMGCQVKWCIKDWFPLRNWEAGILQRFLRWVNGEKWSHIHWLPRCLRYKRVRLVLRRHDEQRKRAAREGPRQRYGNGGGYRLRGLSLPV